MSGHKSIGILVAALLASASLVSGCQEVEQPSPVLTQKQWSKVKEHIKDPKEAPEPEYKIGANFGDKIELIGFSVGDPNKKEESIVAGERTTFRWYWKALDDMNKNWKIFVHFDSKDTSVDPAKRRQNLDHSPLDGLFPTSKWPKGKVVEDIQQVRIRGDYPAGPAVPYIGFFRGKTRLPIKNEVPKTKDRRVKAPSLTVANKSQGKSTSDDGPDKPRYTVDGLDEKAVAEMSVDGKLDEAFWNEVEALNLSPFGSGPELESTVKVFTAGGHLYVGAHMQDQHVWSNKKKRDSNTWEEEVVEMFVDPDGDGNNYLELQINPLGTIFDANFKNRLGTGKGSRREQIDRAKKFTLEGLESAVHVEGTPNDKKKEDEFWSIEMKVPLASIPGVDGGEKPTRWAVNFYRFDRPSKQRTLSFAWSTEPKGDFHQVGKFGVFTFGGGDDGAEKPKLNPEAIKRLQQNGKVPTPNPQILKQNPEMPGSDKKAKEAAKEATEDESNK